MPAQDTQKLLELYPSKAYFCPRTLTQSSKECLVNSRASPSQPTVVRRPEAVEGKLLTVQSLQVEFPALESTGPSSSPGQQY